MPASRRLVKSCYFQYIWRLAWSWSWVQTRFTVWHSSEESGLLDTHFVLPRGITTALAQGEILSSCAFFSSPLVTLFFAFIVLGLIMSGLSLNMMVLPSIVGVFMVCT